MEDLPTPLSRVELYLAKACGMDVTVPTPESRLELFLAKIAGEDVEMPTSHSLTEQWLAYVAGTEPAEPLAIEGACLIGNEKVDVRYFAVAASVPGASLPEEPQNRKEQYWEVIAGGAPTPGILKYATGINIALADVVSGIEELQYVYGDATQNGTPNPDSPVNVQTVTGEQTVTITGKNLLEYDYASLKAANPTTAARTWDDATKTMTFYDVTYKVNDDGSITVNGTASGGASFFYLVNSLSLTVGGEYILNGCPDGGSLSGYSVRLYDGGSYKSDFGSGLDFIFGTQSGVRINISNGTTVNNMVIKPMVRLASDSDPTYEPYTGRSYTLDLGTTELYKIDDYQDYIYKSGNDWFVHKAIEKVTLTGDADESWSGGNNNIYFFHVIAGAYQPENRSTIATILCDYYTPRTYNQVASTTIDYGVALDSNNVGRLAIRNKDCANATAFKTWLASNNTTVYYPLATPTDTKITDATLISQLNTINAAVLPKPVAHIAVGATDTNLPAPLKIAYYGSSEE